MRRLIRRAAHPAILGALLGLLLYIAGRPPRPEVWIGPVQTVHTLSPKLGVHTRLTDEVEEWKIKRTLEMVREMGAGWIVEYFPWAYYEPARGNYQWSHPDMVVDHALAQGLRIIARIDFVPEWARPEETTFRYLDADGYDDYGDFVAAFAEHYRGRIQHYVIWNEPNLSFEWGYRPVDPEAYVELLRVAYTRIKAVDPDALVLGAGLAPTLAPPGSEWGMTDLEYLQRMYDAGASQVMDGMAVHAYGWTFPYDDSADASVVNFRRAELVHEVMKRNGDGNKPCYITEAGWNDHPRWTKGVRPYDRIANTLGALDMVEHDWDWCPVVAWWAFRYPRPALTYQDYFTFVTADFVPKPIYLEVQAYAAQEGAP